MISAMSQMALLIYAGTEVEDIRDTLPAPIKPENVQDEDWNDYKKSITKLTSYFSPKQSNDFALHQMMSIKPTSGENITDYATKLRKAGEKCSFTDWSAQKMIKCIRLKFLQCEHTLDQILDIARKKEDATARSKIMREEEKNYDSVNMVERSKIMKSNGAVNQVDRSKIMKADEKRDDGSIGNIHWNRQGKKKPLYMRVDGDKKRSERRTCTRCGNERHNSRDWPPNGQVCSYFKGRGHYSSLFFKKYCEGCET